MTLFLLPLVIIVLIIAAVVGSRKNYVDDPERGRHMIKTVYVYLVLFATLMMTIGGTVAAFMAIADIVAPPAYSAYSAPVKVAPDGTQTAPAQNLSAAEQQAQQDKFIAQEKAQARQRAVNSLIKSFGWIVIPLPVFIYFQRRVKDHPVS